MPASLRDDEEGSARERAPSSADSETSASMCARERGGACRQRRLSAQGAYSVPPSGRRHRLPCHAVHYHPLKASILQPRGSSGGECKDSRHGALRSKVQGQIEGVRIKPGGTDLSSIA